MKTISTITIFLLFSVTCFSQTYRIYTAKANGNFNSTSTWNNVVRTDGVLKNRYIIPASRTVTVPTGFDFTDLGDIEVVVEGTLNIAVNAFFNLTQNSGIDVPVNGKIRTSGFGGVMIGNSFKLLSLVPRL